MIIMSSWKIIYPPHTSIQLVSYRNKSKSELRCSSSRKFIYFRCIRYFLRFPKRRRDVTRVECTSAERVRAYTRASACLLAYTRVYIHTHIYYRVTLGHARAYQRISIVAMHTQQRGTPHCVEAPCRTASQRRAGQRTR